MTNTNAEQTNHIAAANDAAVICRHKRLFGMVAWIGSLPNIGLW